MRRDALSVAVVGGGIFGTTAAIELSRRGHRVALYEGAPDLLRSASGINQYRLHRGYHYPRSRETAIDCRDSEVVFREAFGEAVLDRTDHYYAISARDSLTSPEEYLAFCRSLDLEVEAGRPAVMAQGAVALSVRVRESMFDPDLLRSLVWDRLRAADVEVHLGSDVELGQLDGHDFLVIATYAELNRLLADLPDAQRAYQFEVCEKPVVRLPASFAHHSVVVMDGPFMCFDPLGTGGAFVLGNVVHAIHTRNVGLTPEIPEALVPLLNQGIVERPSITNIDHFVEAAVEYFPEFDRAVHVGSMYTVRAVLPGVERTDARPTLVRRVSDRVITLFSGKIATCVAAAGEVGRILDEAAVRT